LGLTDLEAASVMPQTWQNYAKTVIQFRTYAALHQLELSSPDAVDLSLARYLDVLFSVNRDVNEAQKLYAAWCALYPAYGRLGTHRLPRVLRTLKGWNRRAPPKTRVPLPFVFMMGIAFEMATSGSPVAAVALMLAFTAYLRPSEGFKLKGVDLVRPRPPLSTCYALNLHAEEHSSASKVGARNEALLLDDPDLSFLGPCLDSIRRQDLEPLLPIRYRDFVTAFRLAQGRLNLPVWFIPYQARHGGPSHDMRLRRRSLLEIKMRGRWASDSSLRRYEAHARVQALENLASPEALSACMKAVAEMDSVLPCCIERWQAGRASSAASTASKSSRAPGTLRRPAPRPDSTAWRGTFWTAPGPTSLPRTPPPTSATRSPAATSSSCCSAPTASPGPGLAAMTDGGRARSETTPSICTGFRPLRPKIKKK